MSYARKFTAWVIDVLRSIYPFLVCWIGGLAFAAGWHDDRDGAALVVTVIAGVSFIWANDMAFARGKAKGESEASAKLIAAFTTGEDTEININFNHRRPE